MSSNRDRQRRHRERLAEQGLRRWSVDVTEDERFYLERVLLEMRKDADKVPALMRSKRSGRFSIVDV